jgi:hypothetical protein
MRRWLCVLTLGMLLVGVPTSTAGAARPTTTENTFTVLDCRLSEGDLSGSVFARDSSQFGTLMDVRFGFDIIGLGDAIFADGSVTGTVELVHLDGGSLGDAVLDATLTPIGDVERFEESRREGNVLIRHRTSFQTLEVDGTLTALGTVFDLTDCFAETREITITVTSPDAFVSVHHSFAFLSCSFETVEGFVFLSAFSDRFVTLADLFSPAGIGSSDDVVLTARKFDATFELFDRFTGQPVGVATADAIFTASGMPQIVADGPTKSIIRTLEVEGTLTLPRIGELDMSSCTAEQVLVDLFIQHR